MRPDDVYGRQSDLAFLLKQAQGQIGEWRKELQAGIETWVAENGYSAADQKTALALIDELKARGVKEFKGLGIEVKL